MTFGVGDGFFKGQGCNGFVTCHGASGESCAVFPCPPYDGIYAGWWTSGCGATPPATFYLHYWTGSRWELVSKYTPDIYEGYVWVRWAMSEGNCGYAYKITFVEDEAFFLVGDVPASQIPCEMWTKDMISTEKDRLKELIRVEKDDASADVKAEREEAKIEVAKIRGEAKIDIKAERGEYKEISTAIRDQAKIELATIRDLHNVIEAGIKATYVDAKAVEQADEKEEKKEVRDDRKVGIDEERQKKKDDIGNIRIQRNLDVEAEYQERDNNVKARYAARDLRIQEIKDLGKPCVVF